MARVKSYFEDVRSRCLSDGILFEDPAFPAVPSSIYFSKPTRSIKWLRPGEIVEHPKFFEEGASRFDLHQGRLGNCWFVAAAAILASRKELHRVVVPGDQQFDERYAGVFHFNFWCFGAWKEVLIDDRLPTIKSRDGPHLVFCCNREKPDEFWSALLEKAYAKLFGSYEALESGLINDALVDFTGGIGYYVDLKRKRELPEDLFARLHTQNKMCTLMGCSINATRSTMEKRLENGLVIGHAYSITQVLEVTIDDERRQLLRLRNPWGVKEWNGPWSDRSVEWNNVDLETSRQLGLVVEEDGEFWMSFEDWSRNFQMLNLCHLPPHQLLPGHAEWKELSFSGSWVRGVNSGGSMSPSSEEYWSNSQYCVRLQLPDQSVFSRGTSTTDRSVLTDKFNCHSTGDDDKCSVVVSLMQKHSRLNKTRYNVQSAEIAITFDLYKVKDDRVPANLTAAHFNHSALQLARRGSKYKYDREVADNFRLEPGLYVIIPATAHPRGQADYLLRVYTVSSADGREMDTVTEPIKPVTRHSDTLQDLFDHHAGSDHVVDYRELQLILNHAFSQELGRDHSFDLETCRSLLSMLDDNRSGVLEMSELERLWAELMMWRSAFHQFDKNDSGFVEIHELRNLFQSVGYKLSRLVLKAVVRRYGGKEGKLAFNDFALAVTKIVSLVDKFPQWSNNDLNGKAELSLDEFLEVLMHF